MSAYAIRFPGEFLTGTPVQAPPIRGISFPRVTPGLGRLAPLSGTPIGPAVSGHRRRARVDVRWLPLRFCGVSSRPAGLEDEAILLSRNPHSFVPPVRPLP